MTQANIRPTAQPEIKATTDQDRRASWLHSAYSDQIWIVSDTHDHSRTAKIDFGFMLADGRSLMEVDRLCATVKEYAWWVRDPRFSRIDDAFTHASMVRNLMNLAHALTIRGISSFAHLQPYDLEQLVEECRYGADAVLRASERVQEHLQTLAADNERDPKPFGGLPPYIIPSRGVRSGGVHTEKIVAACNLPPSATILPRVSALIRQAAVANGLRRDPAPEEIPQLTNVTVQALQRWLDPLEQLYAMRRHIDAEAITFKPFPRGAARVAAVKGVGTERTPTPPPQLALHLLEHAARSIFDNDVGERADFADRKAVVSVATACWIVIAAFSARRKAEIDDLRDGCLRGNDEDGWWLQIYIEKTLQRRDWIPVPTLVARAIATLSEISRAAREASRTDHLFQWLGANGEATPLDVARHLDDFALRVGVPLHRSSDSAATPWHWHPHQFRRFFAILYFYRFEGATLEALSHHLRHFNLEMTRRYVTQDPEAAALWTDVEWGYMGHVARSITAGERSVSGGAGERLKKAAHRLLDGLRRKLQVTSPDRAGASLALIMQRQGLVLTPKPWVTCSCPKTREAAKQAACRREHASEADAVGPDFANAGPTICSACPHAIIEKRGRTVVDVELNHLEAAAEHGARKGTMFGALEAARIVEVRRAKEIRYDAVQALETPPQAGGPSP